MHSKKYTITPIHLVIITILISAFFILPNFFNLPEGEINQEPQLEDKTEILKAEKQELEKTLEKIEIEKQIKELEIKKEEVGLKVQSQVTKTNSEVNLAQVDKSKIQNYINTYFPKTPITAQMILDQSTKTGVPVDFILAVGHNESHMGTKGRAVETKNPFNVGNVTAGDNKPTNCNKYSNCLNSWQNGLDAFTSLISKCYFKEGEDIKLQTWINRDFKAVRCDIAGKRYMTDTKASSKYKERINNLKKFGL